MQKKFLIVVIIFLLVLIGVCGIYFARNQKQKINTKEYDVFVDSTTRRVKFLLLEDQTYDTEYKSDVQESEESFGSCDGCLDSILLIKDVFLGASDMNIIIISPSGKQSILDEHTEIFRYQQGRTITVKNPEPGIWKLYISGSGKFSLGVWADASTDIFYLPYASALDFVKLDTKKGQDYFSIGTNPSIGTKEIMEIDINFSKEYKEEEIPLFYMVDETGKETLLKFYEIERGGYAFRGVVEIPNINFRIMTRGVDLRGFAYKRVRDELIQPEEKPARFSQQEIDEFIQNMKTAK